MQEGLSYILGCELPCVIVNMVRGGPGLGNIAPAQSDYWLTTRGLGHGDGQSIVFAPYSVQELHDFTADAFEIAARYRLPVTILGDAALAQLSEGCRLRPRGPALTLDREWAVGGGLENRQRRVINSLWVQPDVMEAVNLRLAQRLQRAAELTAWHESGSDDPEILVCAYGIMARVAETAIQWSAQRGVSARLFRPITLVPFPYEPIAHWASKVNTILVLELSMGQMVQDVRLAVEGKCDVEFMGRAGGQLVYPEEVADTLVALAKATSFTAKS
jgi:2-oxoglutarate ferredoxin oxidoreductase subunit alpha